MQRAGRHHGAERGGTAGADTDTRGMARAGRGTQVSFRTTRGSGCKNLLVHSYRRCAGDLEDWTEPGDLLSPIFICEVLLLRFAAEQRP